MPLPRVKIDRIVGTESATLNTDTGVGLIVCGATTVSTTLVSDTVYEVYSLSDVTKLGATQTNNAFLLTTIKDFYTTANTGTLLRFMIADGSKSIGQTLDKTVTGYANRLLQKAGGAVTLLGVCKKNAANPIVRNGLHDEVGKAIPIAQALAVDYAARNIPVNIIIDGLDFSGTVSDLVDYSTGDKNAVSVFLGTYRAGKNSAIGLLLGALSKLPVQRKVSRVKNGSLPISEAFFTNGVAADEVKGWDSIHDKGYIFIRKFDGKDGYFFSSDKTLAAPSNDYSGISAGRVIGKATRLLQKQMLELLDDEIPKAKDGTIDPAMAKYFEQLAWDVIAQNMKGAYSNLVVAIDNTAPYSDSEGVKISMQIQPVGYVSLFTIKLGLIKKIST